jgi:ubiquinone/menaquinone biosynthesis C-methylase UbiE
MEQAYPGNPLIWEGWAEARVQDLPAAKNLRILRGPHNPAEFAQQLYAYEALNPAAPCPRPEEGAEPYSLQWFLNVENQRHGRQGRWIPKLLEFAKHSGETLLGIGNGLGTDWLQFARHGAAVVVCTPSSQQLSLIRRNFELRGLSGRFLHGTPSCLPIESASIDVVCVTSLLDEVEDPKPVVAEVYRVLKPGGKVLAVTAARYDVDYWTRILTPWSRWFRKSSTFRDCPVKFSIRRLKKLFGLFVEHRVHKRQLRRRELPQLWRWLPLPLLERLMGHVLVLKAFKPLSVALPSQISQIAA